MGKSRALVALTSMVLCACYVLTASLFLALKNFNHLILAWGQDLQMTVYLKETSTKDEVQALISQLKASPNVHEVTKVSSEENFRQFKNQMGSLLPSAENQSEIQALVPSTLQILFNIKDSLSEPVRIFSEMADKLRESPFVDEVSYGQLWVEKFSDFFTIVRQLLWFTALVLLVASIFVFSSSVRTLVEAKRYEIEVMELVGATRWKIRKPFVFWGALLGFLSGALATLLVAMLLSSLKVSLAESEMLASMALHIQNFTLNEAVAFVFTATAAGVLAAYLCVREINSGWAAVERR